MKLRDFGFCLFAFGSPLFATLPSASSADKRPVPVIDMHAHVFNVRDLPVGGIVGALLNEVSRKPEINRLSEPQRERLKSALTDALERNAEHAPPRRSFFKARPRSLNTPVRSAPVSSLSLAQEVTLTDEEREIFATTLGLEGADWEQRFSIESARKATPKVLIATTDLPSDLHRLAEVAEAAGWMMEPEHAGHAEKVSALAAGPGGYARFLHIMLQSRETIVAELLSSYPQSDLFVCHMMDMARTYAGKPRVPFERQQKEMPDLVRRREGKLVHFTAVDPFRGGDAALSTVRAGLDAGAIGVKIYPPSGYRAANNEIEARPSHHSGAAKRWDSRYEKNGADVLNDTLEKFFAEMEKERIPVFAHCTSQGFEASKDYGLNADPKYWAPVLEKHPELRLCFGHAGGHQFWFNAPDAGAPDTAPAHLSKEDRLAWDFGKEVVRLCRTYKNVYCEVAYLEKILTPKGAAAFKARLAEELAKPTPPGQYDLKTKIMYGTDWHMIHKEANYQAYLARCNELVKDIDGGDWQARFFAGNAITFLKLDSLAADTRFSEAQRTHWRRLIDRRLP